MNSKGKWLRILNFIFRFIVIVLERVNLILLGGAGACQPRTTNEGHKISGDNAGAYIILHSLVKWSYLEK